MINQDRNYSILIIEDSESDRFTYRRYLLANQNFKYQILEAETLDEGLELWRKKSPDLLLVDINLPDGSGLELLKVLNKRYSRQPLPVIVVSGQGNERIAVQAMKLGASDYLAKDDITASTLCHTVENTLKQWNLAKDIQQLTRLGSWEFDVLTGKLTWSQELFDIFRINPANATLTFDYLSSYFTPHSNQVRIEAVSRAIQYGEPFEVELEIIRADGTRGFILSKAIPQHDDTGKVVYLWGGTVDISDRKEMERALQLSEARFRRLFDANIIGMLFADFQGQIIDANDCFLQELGYTRPELNQGLIRWDQITPPEYAQQDEALVIQLKETGYFLPVEKEYYRKDGSRLAILLGGAFLFGSDGQTICIAVNISDRKKAELALKQNQYLLQKITDSSPNIIYLYDVQQKRNVYVNQQIEVILGYTPDEIQAMGADFFCRLIHPDDLPVLPAAYERLAKLQDDEIHEFECRLKHANGQWRWLYNRDKVFSRDESGQVKLSVGSAQDITKRKQIEEDNRKLKERLQFMIATTPAVFFSCVAVGNYRITFISENIQSVLGYSAATVMADENFWFDHLHPEDRPQILAKLPTLFEQGKSCHEYRYLHQNGTYRWMHNELCLVRDDQGEPLEIVGYFADISDRKLAEIRLQQINQELARATRLKDEFLANMSHELRTPLNAILGMTEGLQDQVYGPINPKQLDCLETIERSGFHLLELINDILDLSKIESGQLTLDYNLTAIAPLCQASLAFIQQQAFNKHIQIQAQIPQDLPDVWIDERRIRQVLINLLNNAVKFTPEGGNILLIVAPIASPAAQSFLLRISIIDNGIGIAPEDIPKLFKPFIQIDSALNRKYEGTGLGLALVKNIVELHGGQVSLQSELGKGSCFSVDLPCADCELFLPNCPMAPSILAGESHQQKTRAESSRSFLILLAEDNAANVLALSDYLTVKGYRLIVANNGEMAITLAQSEKPDLILMDIQMPGMDGLEAIKQIRLNANLAQIPIIALTALAMPGDRDRCLKAGANEYVSKPVRLKQLTNLIQEMLVSVNE
ncbi:MAG: PAS domain-containing protein [Snowella sp.]|nr:PAS domain-containing protein [Snowella sp.]